MPSQQEIDAQREVLATHRRNLAVWIGQQAIFGLYTPPYIVQGIEQERDAIRRIKRMLRGWGITVEDHPDDEPPGAEDAAPGAGAPPRIPSCPAPNAGTLLGRDAIRDELIARLSGDAQTLAISAVRGLPGVGKTDLLRAVGTDERITAHFGGGVLYAELGPAPDAAQILRRWRSSWPARCWRTTAGMRSRAPRYWRRGGRGSTNCAATSSGQAWATSSSRSTRSSA